jgi:hypothetical protein
MDKGLIWTAAVAFIVSSITCGVLALALRGVAERWAIIGVIVSIAGIVVAITLAGLPHSDGINSQKTSGEPTPYLPSGSPTPGVTSLPAGSPLRKQTLDMDQVCNDFGLSQHAWLPGQTSATNLTGRAIIAPNAAYTWSCNKNGRVLTRDEITLGCQISYPGTNAYTLDPNDAYSWICIKP